MKFSQLEITANGSNVTYQPYDRGAAGAFVYREAVPGLFQPRVLVSTSTNDNASDKMIVQLNTPRVCVSEHDCTVPVQNGTDLVKTELRFLATTSEADRIEQIDRHIALLQELRGVIEGRGVIYA